MREYSDMGIALPLTCILLIVALMCTGMYYAELCREVKNETVNVVVETVEEVVAVDAEASLLSQIEDIGLPIPLSDKEIRLQELKDEAIAIVKTLDSKKADLIAREKRLDDRENHFEAREKKIEDSGRILSKGLKKGLTPNDILKMYGEPSSRSMSMMYNDVEKRIWYFYAVDFGLESTAINYLRFNDDKLVYWDLDFNFIARKD